MFVHISGVLGFMTAHGTSSGLTARLRKERDPARLRALLDMSRSGRNLLYGSLVALLTGGIANGFVGHYWDRGWIWVGLGLLVVLLVAPFFLAVPYFKELRRAVGSGDGPATATADELDRLLMSGRPVFVAWFETIGVAVIVFFMVFKPF